MGLKIHLFGLFEAWRDGTRISERAWGREKTKALFKILVSERGRVFTQDQLIEYLWPDADPHTAASNLRGRIREMRRALEPELQKGAQSQYILTHNQSYSFSAEADCWLDTEAFQKQLEAARGSAQKGRLPEALESYQHAIQLYRGEYLAEDLYEEWTLAPRERWRELSLTALERSAECHARLGQYPQAIAWCQRVIEQQPDRESAYRQKMLYHHLAGESSQALKTYQACAKTLQEELQVETASQTRALYEQILKGELFGLDGYPPTPPRIQHNLPSPLTSFIGRKKEITEVKRLLSRTRLLTLTGVGGCGKTRLALQACSELLDEFAAGVWWVELAALLDPKLVPQVVATALGVREQPGRSLTETLFEFFKPKKALLVLDNCEHLIDACAGFIEALLPGLPDLQVLATSREALGLIGETVWKVPPLACPDPQNLPPLEVLKQWEVVSLFTERALASYPEFELNRENALSVSQICYRLDGIPLAIELAAMRVKTLSVEEIAARLDDRFRLLTEGSRMPLPRHQTLQATMDWSFSLLSSIEQILLRRLSVFTGGFTLEAAEAVGGNGLTPDPSPARRGVAAGRGEVLDLLANLVDKSLVVFAERGGKARYRLLETVRQYCGEKLLEAGESERVRNRHLGFFLTLAERAEPELQGSKQQMRLDQLERDHDNLWAALRWSVESGQAETGLRLAGALWWFWYVRGYLGEGREWLTAVLSLGGGRTAERAKALNGAGSLASSQGDYAAARSCHEESLAIQRELGDKHGIAKSLNNLGVATWRQGDYQASRSFHEEALAIHRELGNKRGIAVALNNLGVLAREQHDYGRARSLFEESLSIGLELGNKRGIALAMTNLGDLAYDQGDSVSAERFYKESLVLQHELGDKRGVAECLERLSKVACKQAKPAHAARLWGAAEALREAIGVPIDPADRVEYECTVAAARAALSEEEFAQAWAQGRVMTLEQATACALERASIPAIVRDGRSEGALSAAGRKRVSGRSASRPGGPWGRR